MKISLAAFMVLAGPLFAQFSPAAPTAPALPAPPAVVSDLPKPTAVLKRFEIESISLREALFRFDIAVTNPYPLDINLEAVRLKFSVEKKQVFQTSTSQGFAVPARGEKVNSFKVNLKFDDIIAVVKDYAKKDWLAAVIDTAVVIPLPELPGLPKSVTLDFTLEAKLPAVKPAVAIRNFKVSTPSRQEIEQALKKADKQAADSRRVQTMLGDLFSGRKPKPLVDPRDLDLKVRVAFDIELRNDTRAALVFDSLDYDFSVNGAALLSGKTDRIKSKGPLSTLSVVGEFSTRSLGEAVLKAFNAGKGEFGLKGATLLRLPESVRKEPLRLEFSEKGLFSTK